MFHYLEKKTFFFYYWSLFWNIFLKSFSNTALYGCFTTKHGMFMCIVQYSKLQVGNFDA